MGKFVRCMSMAPSFPSTLEDSASIDGPVVAAAGPGAVLVYARRPALQCVPFEEGKLVVGRDAEAQLSVADERVSRMHVEVRREAGQWIVRDLGSRNGTFIDGERVERCASDQAQLLMRVGHVLILLVPELSAYLGRGVTQEEGQIIGPSLQAVRVAIERIAQHGSSLLLQGETGAGKELAARWFHRATGRGSRSFVAVNCAAIPAGLAERVLFGARRGAFSGADRDADGHVQAAHGGTLFLDEIAELDLSVQAKLLRLLQSGEVLPLGAAVPTTVDLRICAATHRELEREVAQGRFRADLYYRIARPALRIPPLRERREEIPWLAAHVIRDVSETLAARPRLIETCCLRPWPGNLRELHWELRHAAATALSSGAKEVGLEHLADGAGLPLDGASDNAQSPSAARADIDGEAIRSALAHTRGNVSAAARELGVHRVQLYRLFRRFGIIHER